MSSLGTDRRRRRGLAIVALVAFLTGALVAIPGCGGGKSSNALVLDLASKHRPIPSEGATVEIDSGEAFVTATRRQCYVDIEVDLEAERFNAVELAVELVEGGTHHAPRVAWRRAGESDFAGEDELPFLHQPRNSKAPELVHLQASPGWRGRIDRLRVYGADLPSEVRIVSVRFVRVAYERFLDLGAANHVTLGPETRIDARYVPVGAVIRESFEITRPATLTFAVGVPDWVWDRGIGPIVFRVAHDAPERRRELHRVILDGRTRPEDRGWVDRTVELLVPRRGKPGVTETLDLLFDTNMGDDRVEEEVPAFFAHPTVRGSEAPADRGGRPNVLLVSLDTLRADHLGGYGYRRSTTPWLDRLSRDAVVFESAKAQAAKTLPSHMSLFTGLLPQTHTIVDEVDRLPEGWSLWVDSIRGAGYRTAAYTEDAFVAGLFGFKYGFERYHDGAARERR